jgi:hypothetical protein
MTECICSAVVPFHLEVAMGGSEPTFDNAFDVYLEVSDEKTSRLFLASVSGVALDLNPERRLGHGQHILVWMGQSEGIPTSAGLVHIGLGKLHVRRR